MNAPRALAFAAAALWVSLAGAALAWAARAEAPGSAAEDATTVARLVDKKLAAAWEAAGVEPAARATDAEFLRRAYLDFTGVTPRVSEARAFLDDPSETKRSQLVERLLESPRYATHMATTWRNRILPLGVDSARSREALGLQKWLRQRFAENLRYDRMVGGLLLASGDNEVGPALYFQANDVSPEKLAGSAAELFMGVDLHCAQCHDHPYAEWSQRDFWGLAAFFARTRAADDQTVDPRAMSYRLVDLDRGEVTLPESDEVVPPRFPLAHAEADRSLGEVAAPATDDQWQSRRSQLVVWLTSRDNEFFARATVNAAWLHLFGQPLVETIRPPTGEGATPEREALDLLAASLVESDIDIRQLWRTLAAPRAYQLSSQGGALGARAKHFARMQPKPLTPEQLYDSFRLLAPGGLAEGGASGPSEALSLDEDPRRVEFVRLMRTPGGAPTEYRAGTMQALALMNGVFTAETSGERTSSLLGALEAPYMTDQERIDAMMLATLTRPADAAERAALAAMLGQCTTPAERREALSDLLWALLNSTEFAFNH
ncbi:MAG TPA: DUF1549 domain-containing protein [Lacipirellulaceae bacterium]|nr:DUF1549 domain-containing protein [Lacipirellulaceae bacterium]